MIVLIFLLPASYVQFNLDDWVIIDESETKC